MLNKRKQLALNLMITTFLVTANVAVSYASNSGGTVNIPNYDDYTGNYVASGSADATGGNVNIDSDVAGNVHGGYNDGTGDASNNKVTVSNGTINEVGGGIAVAGNANSNIVNISDGTISGDVYGGYSSGDAENNSASISGGTITNIFGGYADGSGSAKNNSVYIFGGTINNDVYGGFSDTGSADGNRVTISGGDMSNDVFVGYSDSGNAKHNVANISGGTIYDDVFVGYSKNGNAENNIANISGGTISEDVFVGYSKSGDANGNILNLSNGKARDVSAGVSINGSVSNNTINISGGTIRDVSAGISSGNASGNNVIISGGNIRDVSGGISYSGDAINNSASISGGTIKNIFGGYTDDTGSAKNNSVYVSGGTIEENIFGGYSYSGDAITNTVIIKGDPIFNASSIIYGGHTTSLTADVLAGNRLEVYRSTNITGTHVVKGVENFSTMNFYLGNATKNGDIMLKVADEIKLSNTAIGVDIATGEKPQLVVGDKVTLLESDNKFTTTPKSQTTYAGIEKIYGLDFFQEEKSLGVTVSKVNNNSKVRSMPIAQMTAQSMLKIGGDTIAGQGITSALTATTVEEGKNFKSGKSNTSSVSSAKIFTNTGAVFATMGGGTSKYKTSGTSDVKGFNIVTGMAWRVKQPQNNNLLLGAFFESGWGNYTTHNSFSEGNVRGDGSSDYMGGGILGRYEFSSGTYVESSVRMGRVKNDYHSYDLRSAGDGRLGYNTSDNYTGIHLGLGYIQKLNRKTELDWYGKYFYTHQGGSSVTVAGDNIRFEPTNSQLLRLGARLSQKTTTDFSSYLGIAYEYEFDGKMNSSINYTPILAPSVQGSSGVIELGIIFKPAKNKNLSIDLSVNGYVGKREGVSGNLQFKYLF